MSSEHGYTDTTPMPDKDFRLPPSPFGETLEQTDPDLRGFRHGGKLPSSHSDPERSTDALAARAQIRAMRQHGASLRGAGTERAIQSLRQSVRRMRNSGKRRQWTERDFECIDTVLDELMAFRNYHRPRITGR